MLIEEKALIISSKQFRESSFIVKCLFERAGMIAGLYNPRRGKYIQKPIIGSIVYAKWQARLEEHLGFFSYENITNIPSLVVGERMLLLILDATLSMIDLLSSEKEPNNKLFHGAITLLEQLVNHHGPYNNILSSYIKFELFGLLSSAGFGLDISKCIVTNTTQNLAYISPKSAAAVSLEVGMPYHSQLFKLPKFLLYEDFYITTADIKEAYSISLYFLNKHLLTPYNRKLPIMRKLLQETVLSLHQL